METLKSNRDFERVFRKGRSVSHRDLVVLGRKRRPSGVRVGFCISRKTGKAVQRNKLRRRLKEIVRQVGERLDPKWDLVIVSKQNSASLSFAVLKLRLSELLERLGALTGPP